MRKGFFIAFLLLIFSGLAFAKEPIFAFLEPDGSQGKPHHLTEEDMTLHLMDNFWYTESYFFIAYLDSGEIAYLNLIISNMGTKKHQPALTLTIITPERHRLTTEKDFSPEDLKISKKGFWLQIGDNLLYGDDKHLKLKVKQAGLGLELEFSSPVSGIKLGDGCAWFGKDKKIFYCINYPAPRARVQGKIFYSGKEVPARGWGYVDHCWYNANTTDFERVWHNLKFFSSELNLIITSFTTPERFGSERVGIAFLVNDKEVLDATTKIKVKESSHQFDSVGKKNYPQRLIFELNFSSQKAEIDFDSSRLVEKMDVLEKLNKSAGSRALKWLINTFICQPYYYRSFGKTELKLSLEQSTKNIKGEASCEVIFVK